MDKTTERTVNIPKPTQQQNKTLPLPKQPFASGKTEYNPLAFNYKGVDNKNSRNG